MKRKNIRIIENPYEKISESEYQVEKRRLQVELLKIQQWLVRQKLSLVVVFEGRDAAGKGSTIKRFTENLMPAHFSINALGVPSESESKYWFRRYESLFPEPGNIAFFDRSWYSRALIEPTMGYCSEKRYKRFMRKVLNWEHTHIDKCLLMVKFYLSVAQVTHLLKFETRLRNPLTYRKFSKHYINDRRQRSQCTKSKNNMRDTRS